MCPNIRAIHRDKDRQISENRDATLISVSFQRGSLLEEFELIEGMRQACAGLDIRALDKLAIISVRFGPFRPRSMTKSLLKRHEQGVGFQPLRIGVAKL